MDSVALQAEIDHLRQENATLRARLTYYEGRPTIPVPTITEIPSPRLTDSAVDWDDSSLLRAVTPRGSDAG